MKKSSFLVVSVLFTACLWNKVSQSGNPANINPNSIGNALSRVAIESAIKKSMAGLAKKKLPTYKFLNQGPVPSAGSATITSLLLDLRTNNKLEQEDILQATLDGGVTFAGHKIIDSTVWLINTFSKVTRGEILFDVEKNQGTINLIKKALGLALVCTRRAFWENLHTQRS